MHIYSLNDENSVFSVPVVLLQRLTRNLEDAEDEGDDVSTDFRLTTRENSDAIFGH